MIYYGWTEFDPVEGSAQSIDPLRSQAHAGKLSDLVFPGSSGRVWRARYLSALCFLMKHAQLEKGVGYRTNYLKFRKFENALILAQSVLKRKYSDKYDFNTLIGMVKAGELIRTNGARVDITGDILANQMNLGPLGQHAVLMRSMELIESTERELILFPKGEELANLFEASIGEDARKLIEPLQSANVRNVRVENLENLSESLAFEINTRTQQQERSRIVDLLNRDPVRKQLFSDILGLPNFDSLSEAQFIDRLAETSSPLQLQYKLIQSYENFQRILHHYFTAIRQVPKDQFIYKLSGCERLDAVFKEMKPQLIKRCDQLLQSVDRFLEGTDDAEEGSTAEIREHASAVKDSTSSQEEFSAFLIHFHQNHQRAKGKAPWVRLESHAKAEVSPYSVFEDHLPTLAKFCETSTHGYRFSNCRRMILDLGLIEGAA